MNDQPGQPFPLGVNYWPRRKAMYWWGDFDRGEVAEEFDVIASVGMSVVRVFLLWDDWQPTSDQVSTERLVDFGTVCDLAAERGLGLDVTFFTGHMSGPNWSPGWLLDPAAASHPSPHVRQVVSGGRVVDTTYRNMFHDPEALDGRTAAARDGRRSSTGTTKGSGCGTWGMSRTSSLTPIPRRPGGPGWRR